MKSPFLAALLVLAACTGLRAQNPVIRHVFTADPAPLVYRDTLLLYTSHDTASVQETNYKMPDWRTYATTDMVHWQSYGKRLSPKAFAWATGDAYAAQCIEHKSKFYWFVATFHRKDDHSQGGAAIGVPNSFTTHPGIVDYRARAISAITTGRCPPAVATAGPSASIIYTIYNPDGTSKPIVQTAKGVAPVK